ncbi:MAG: metal-dependent hydrolase [Saprospiraceae bacterium]
MDIITHTTSGLAIATVIASQIELPLQQKFYILFMGCLGGALPDLDAFSLWSGFDNTVGNWLSLHDTGRNIYFGKYWYSHHAFMHSFVAALILSSVIYLILNRTILVKEKLAKYLSFSFLCGYCLHMIEDMPTPGGSWSGINLLWPSSEYVGGSGQIWWWNNYDIFLIAMSVTIINIILIVIKWSKSYSKRLPAIVFTLGIILAGYCINTRGHDFNQKGHGNNEAISLEIQKELLGETLYEMMRKFDHAVKVNF